MIPRKQLDIGWCDFAAAVGAILRRTSRRRLEDAVADAWRRHETVCGADRPHEPSIVAYLSVRSGFDATLAALAWPAGSEVLVSALTIRDMPAILEAHGLKPVPVDVDMDRLCVRSDALAAAVTPQTRGILVAHLFGARMPMAPSLDVARRHDLFVFEDCAQAFTGDAPAGHPMSDVRMASFGPIKTATALGGAILSFRDDALRDRAAAVQSRWPAQSRTDFLRRILRFALLKAISARPLFTAFAAACRWMGKSHDTILSRGARGFPAGRLLDSIRRRPSDPLLALLARRLRQDHHGRIRRRRELAALLDHSLPALDRPGLGAADHSFWVYPIRHDRPNSLMRHLHDRGFDATRGASSMGLVEPASQDADTTDSAAQADRFPSVRSTLARLLYLPFDPAMSPNDVERLAEAIRGFA